MKNQFEESSNCIQNTKGNNNIKNLKLAPNKGKRSKHDAIYILDKEKIATAMDSNGLDPSNKNNTSYIVTDKEKI